MPYGHQPIFYVGEVGPAAAVSRDIPNLGPRVSIVDHQGKLIGRFGETPAGIELGKFLAPHGLAVDSRGDVYVGEVSWTAWPQKVDKVGGEASKLKGDEYARSLVRPTGSGGRSPGLRRNVHAQRGPRR